MPSQHRRHALDTLAAAICLVLMTLSTDIRAQCIVRTGQQLIETPEIAYTGPDAQPLCDKATQLGTAVAIYEYVHNSIEQSPYHGSRSGSTNTFLGQRGSDVDIATALIAMLRSQNIPARYAVGTVRIPVAQLTNWQGIPQIDTAVQVLKDQGIQGVTLAADRSTVDLEHVWAEAFVPFDQYRGINTVSPAVDCSQSANASQCTWVALDASFKAKAYNGLNLDPYNAVTFDYTAYYNAIKNDDATRRDKSPLTILEDQIGAWLRTNYPGKTLEDVEDAGQIIPLREGLLPASLPFQVVGNIRRYDSVASHDAVVPSTEPKKWGKQLTVTISMVGRKSDGGTVTYNNLNAGTALLAEINTKRLTLSVDISTPGSVPNMVTRLGGVELARAISANLSVSGYAPKPGDPFTINVSMDGAPGAGSGSADRTVSATYSGIIGGYYLLATGGESSNWSQVHRAAHQLLAANNTYTIVFNPSEVSCQTDGINCTPYVDANGNGWDSSDAKLLDSKEALDSLTGGLLYVSATQYYAKLREQWERADRLMKIRSPVIGFLGVVSSVYEAEYIDGTAFSILPGGLLIDMKGVAIGGSYRTNEAAAPYSARQFEFLGHIGSSLEHEVWQELTGYDAISTVRGIQMALGSGASLLNVKRNSSTNTVPAFLSSTGFGAAAPSPFSIFVRDVFGTYPTTWSHPTLTGNIGFDAIKKAPASPSDPRLGYVSYYNDYHHTNVTCFFNTENQLYSLRSSYGGSATLNAGSSCGVSWASGTTIDSAIAKMQTGFNGYRGGANTAFFNYLDRNQGFLEADFMYRSTGQPIGNYSTSFVSAIRNDLQFRNIGQNWAEYILPSKLIVGCQYIFQVDILKSYNTSTGQISSISFDIANQGAAPNLCK